MHPIDYTIIGVYVLGLFVIGFLVARKAGQGSDEYFLGGRRMPWWALGASGMSSNLDVAGTITIIALIYTYGLQGFFIEMRGGVVLPIAVWLAFMGKWHRRSGVTTTAEWMELRFGRGIQGRLARYVAALTYLVITVGMVTFFLVAAGKFLADFAPGVPSSVQLNAIQDEIRLGTEAGTLTPDREAELQAEYDALSAERLTAVQWLSVAMAVVALIYTMVSGLYGVVWTDVFQAFIIGGAAVWISYKAFHLIDPSLLTNWPGAQYNHVWPALHVGEPPNERGPGDAYYLFPLFLIFWAGKGILEGLGGSGGSAYMAQRYYAAPSDVATRRLSMLWAVLFAVRWPMVLGMAVIAIHLGIGQYNPERILSGVLQSDFFPVGIRGLAVAAVFAASMSTFDSTINAGASYVVKDLWVPLRSGNWAARDLPGQTLPGVSERSEVMVGYAASAGIVALGLLIALTIPTAGVVEVWTTIVVQLFPAFLVPFTLRWFWSRFNGAGFCIGILFGFVASLLVTVVRTRWMVTMGIEDAAIVRVLAGLNEWQIIATVLATSLVGSVLGTYLAQPTNRSLLHEFYLRIRPFGFWPREWKAGHKAEHHRDVLRLFVALVWQVLTFLLPMVLVLKMWGSLIGLFIPWLVLTVFLWRDAQGAPGDEAEEPVVVPQRA